MKQFLTLTERFFRVKLRDRVSTAILLLQAPIIAILIALVFDDASEKTAALFILVIAAVWLGCSNAAREIVSEQAIFKRERMVNLKIPSYLFSKVTVLMLLCFVQCTILAMIVVPSIDMESSFFSIFFLAAFNFAAFIVIRFVCFFSCINFGSGNGFNPAYINSAGSSWRANYNFCKYECLRKSNCSIPYNPVGF